MKKWFLTICCLLMFVFFYFNNTKIVSANVSDNDGTERIVNSDVIFAVSEEGVRTPRIVSKPKPTFTDEARNEKVNGKVVLACVFSHYGSITDIQLLRGLGYGLDDEAIKAASQILFIPAVKEGKFVDIRARVEYTFNTL